MQYIWEHQDWPNFTWDEAAIEGLAYDYALEASRLVGEVQHLSEDQKTDALIDMMVSEAVKTSQIEGENFDREDVRSSIRNQLGLNKIAERVRDPKANGVAALMISVREHFTEPLTAERLCAWQDMVIVDVHDRRRIELGQWRSDPEPMQIISGAYGHEKVHYEAPPSSRVAGEMERFIDWFNQSQHLKGAVRAGVAHLYFECIHPFADGNGRVGRAISEIALSQELGHPVLMSLSTTMQAQRNDYYDALGKASQGGLDITDWLIWFTAIARDAQVQARSQIDFVLAKARFWDRFSDTLNPRQEKVVERMMREGPAGFLGGMSASKYMKLTGTSKATATRDLAELLTIGAFKRLEGGGRSTHYDIDLT